MSDDDTFATIRASHNKLQQMVDEASLSGDTEHGDLYLNILEDEVRVLQKTPGESVLTYCSYGEEYFDELDVEVSTETVEATDNTGGEIEVEVGAEAIINVDDYNTYLGMVSGGGTIEMEFLGDEDRRLASYLVFSGELRGQVRLPGSQDALEMVPHWLPGRFNSDNEYTNKAGDACPAQIVTKCDKIQRIIRAVEEDRDAEYYPLVVEDGDMKVDVGSDDRARVSGSLAAQSVEGPDVENYYYDGFQETFNVISGRVQIQTVQADEPPAAIVVSGNERTVRHVIGSVAAP